MKLTEFRPEHLAELNGKSIEGDPALLYNSFTAVHDGKVIGCGGVKMLWPGVGEAWAVPSVHVADHKRECILLCKEALRIIWEQEPTLNRIQASVIDGFKSGDRLAEILGFKCEGIMRKFGRNGEDYKLFALVR